MKNDRFWHYNCLEVFKINLKYFLIQSVLNHIFVCVFEDLSKWLEGVSGNSIFSFHFTSFEMSYDQAFGKWLWLSMLKWLFHNVFNGTDFFWKCIIHKKLIRTSPVLKEFCWCYFLVYFKCLKIIHTFHGFHLKAV